MQSITGGSEANILQIKVNDGKWLNYRDNGDYYTDITLGNETVGTETVLEISSGAIIHGTINNSVGGNATIQARGTIDFRGIIGENVPLSKLRIFTGYSVISTSGTHYINNILMRNLHALTIGADDVIIVGNIDGELDSKGVINSNFNPTFIGLLGNTHSLISMNIENNIATIAMAGTHKIDTINLEYPGATITATEDGTVIEGNIVAPNNNNAGEVDVQSDLTVTGDLGSSSSSIDKVTLAVPGKTFTVGGDIYANSGVNFTADATLASTNATGFSWLSPINIATNNTGTISSTATSGSASFGTIGSSGASLKLLQVNSGADISLAGNAYINEINIGSQDPTITVGSDAVISNITNEAGKGTLSITGESATVNLGAHERLKSLEF